MQVIKLDAIDSTNDFLKSLSSQQMLDDIVIVTAEIQTKGRGQMGATWVSEKGKNLLTSILIKNFLTDISAIFKLNIVVALAIIDALEEIKIPNMTIKWPNDIMSANHKIAGILIENSIKSNGAIYSIIGLGLNVNQINFDNLQKASSLSKIMGNTYDKEDLLLAIVNKIQLNMQTSDENFHLLRQRFINRLFKIGVPMPFRNRQNAKFMGIIRGITENGRLEILLEDETILECDIKEVEMLY